MEDAYLYTLNELEFRIKNELISSYEDYVNKRSLEYSGLIMDIIKILEIDPDKVEMSFKKIEFMDICNNVSVIFMNDLIESYLSDKGIIYKGICSFSIKEDEDHYGKSYNILTIDLKSKVLVIRELDSIFVFNNHDSISDFMNDDNDIYNKLTKLKDLIKR